jgi:endonuclease YncB( thermonuclease family)
MRNRPRRIFRPATSRLVLKGIGLVLMATSAAAVIAGVVAIWPRGWTPARSTPPEPQQLTAAPAQVAVVDSGTLRIGERVVRLSGVEPPARGIACGAGEDCATAAADALAAMVRELPVACQVTGKDTMGRPYAICQASGTQLNQAVIAAGWARADNQQPELHKAEATARAEHRGIWAAVHGATW